MEETVLVPRSLVTYLTKNLFYNINTDDRQQSFLKVQQNSQGEVAYKVFKPEDLPVHMFFLFTDRLNQKIKEIEVKIKKSEERYNELVSSNIKFFKEMSQCSSDQKCELHEIATFLIRQKPHLKKHILSGFWIVPETEEDKLARLKQEVGYQATLFKPTRISELVLNEDYGKWREILRLMNLINKRKQKVKQRHPSNISTSPSNNYTRIKLEILEEAEAPKEELGIVGSDDGEKATGPPFEIIGKETDMDQALLDLLISEVEVITGKIPHDSEKESDPLQLVTWKQYYHANEDITYPENLQNLHCTHLDNIKNVYIKLQTALYNSVFNSNSAMSSREEILRNDIVTKFHLVRRDLPEVIPPLRPYVMPKNVRQAFAM